MGVMNLKTWNSSQSFEDGCSQWGNPASFIGRIGSVRCIPVVRDYGTLGFEKAPTWVTNLGCSAKGQFASGRMDRWWGEAKE